MARKRITPEVALRSARLRVAEPKALKELRHALAATSSLDAAAELMGFAGKSTLWRIAYATPAVRAVLKAHAADKRGGVPAQ